MRKFNTEGPVVAADHYHIPPLERIDLDGVLGLIRDKKYFVLHEPRQTGKTSALLALLNGGGQGEFRCVYANVEGGQALHENVAEEARSSRVAREHENGAWGKVRGPAFSDQSLRTVLAELAFEGSVTLGDATLEDRSPDLLERVRPGTALRQALARWSMADPRRWCCCSTTRWWPRAGGSWRAGHGLGN